jgi:hypothetical protein
VVGGGAGGFDRGCASVADAVAAAHCPLGAGAGVVDEGDEGEPAGSVTVGGGGLLGRDGGAGAQSVLWNQ